MGTEIKLPYLAIGTTVYCGDKSVVGMKDEIEAREMAVEFNTAFLDGFALAVEKMMSTTVPVTGTIGGAA